MNRIQFWAHTADAFLAVTFVFHCTLCTWIGCWLFQDAVILTSNKLISNLLALALGISTQEFVDILIPIAKDRFGDRATKHEFLPILVSRFIFYAQGFGYITQWRGTWFLTDYVCGRYGLLNNLIPLTVALVVLGLFRTYVNILGPPFGLKYDPTSQLVVTMPRFRSEERKWYRFVTDHLFGHVIIISHVVFFWRSYWNILDDYLFPDQALTSNLITYSLGLSGCFVLIVINPFVAKLSAKYDDANVIVRLMIENVYALICSVCTVSLWRGTWNLTLLLIISPTPSALVLGLMHVIGNTILLLTCLASNVAPWGIAVDAELKEGLSLRWSNPVLGTLILAKCSGLEERKSSEDIEKTVAPFDQAETLLENKVTAINGNRSPAADGQELVNNNAADKPVIAFIKGGGYSQLPTSDTSGFKNLSDYNQNHGLPRSRNSGNYEALPSQPADEMDFKYIDEGSDVDLQVSRSDLENIHQARESKV